MPLAADGRETDEAESLIAFSHGMNVRNVKMDQLRVGVVGHVLCAFALRVCVCACECVCVCVCMCVCVHV